MGVRHTEGKLEEKKMEWKEINNIKILNEWKEKKKVNCYNHKIKDNKKLEKNE